MTALTQCIHNNRYCLPRCIYFIFVIQFRPEGIKTHIIPRGIDAATSEIVSESTAAQLLDTADKTFRGPDFVKKKVCEHSAYLLENFGVKVEDCKVTSIKVSKAAKE